MIFRAPFASFIFSPLMPAFAFRHSAMIRHYAAAIFDTLSFSLCFSIFDVIDALPRAIFAAPLMRY